MNPLAKVMKKQQEKVIWRNNVPSADKTTPLVEDKTPAPEPKEPDAEATKSAKKKRKRNKSKSKSPTKNEEIQKQEQEEIEKEEKKMKIRRELYEKLKLEGNEHVKKGDYSAAIDCYTRCIKMCPKETPSYTNRALCFLKLKKHVSAVNDCTEAIKLDPINVKAYYRRSLARKAEGFFKDAERDLKKLLEIDPANKAANSELNAIKKSAWDEARKRAGNAPTNEKPKKDTGPKKKPVVIEEVDSSSSSDEGEFILPKENETLATPFTGEVLTEPNTIQPSKKHEKATSASENKSNSNNKVTDKEDGDEQKPTDKKKISDVTDETEQKHIPISPTRTSPSKTTTLTPYEFGAQWNIVTDKSNLSAYKAILDKVMPADLPALLSNKIDDHVISTIAKVALDHIEQDDDSQRAFEMMRNLTKAQRFEMAAMFLSDSDKRILRTTFNALSKHCETSDYDQKDVNALLKTYSL